jgi:hypothetical protein
MYVFYREAVLTLSVNSPCEIVSPLPPSVNHFFESGDRVCSQDASMEFCSIVKCMGRVHCKQANQSQSHSAQVYCHSGPKLYSNCTTRVSRSK